ncbi:MAG: efflux RND transporter periplasmic adaptor subunit [Bacteroidetes bacterium]|nr:MAG: efflux RND transporter periplasmic adaptor subunit [Bacteroidota bacterium]
MNKINIKTLAPVSVIALALSGLFYLLGGCGPSSAEPAKPNVENQPDERIPVYTTQVQTKTVDLPVHASGILTSTAEQRLSFKVGGIIRKVYVDEGDVVRAGQLLAELDKTEIDAQVNQATQALLKAERDLARVEGLYRDSSATLELLENATTARDVARETARIATFNQQYAEIRATRSGKIIRKLMNEGEITGPGTPVFVLFETNVDDWVVKVSVSDRDWARLRTGMPAQVAMDAYPGVSFRGRVTDLAPAADPANGLYQVEIKVTPQGQRFAPGLFATVQIQPGKARDYAAVPIESIIEGDGQEAYVFILEPDDESVRKQPVRVAFLDGDMAMLAETLDTSVEVITSGAPYLTEKKKVKKTASKRSVTTAE